MELQEVVLFQKSNKSDAGNTTGAHEIGHTIGLDHFNSGVMTVGINSSSHGSFINMFYITEIIRGNHQNRGEIGNRTIKEKGNSPVNFNRGKGKKKEK